MREILKRVINALFSKQKIGGFVVGAVLTITAVALEVDQGEIKLIICDAK